ncbi:MAG: DUF6056 family protein [Chloroflexota bacterium]
MSCFQRLLPKNIPYRGVIFLGVLTTSAALVVYAYTGFFTRYTADDYCHTRYLMNASNIFSAAAERYFHTSNRYANMLLIGITEFFGERAVIFLPAVTIVLWVLGLTWLFYQVKKTANFSWHFGSYFWFAELIVFFTILQAPSRYQSVYWRAGLTTYFFPLALFTFIAGYILVNIRRAQSKRFSILSGLSFFCMAFLVGGFSETTLALQVGMLSLAILYVWLWTKGEKRKAALYLLIPALVGSLLALLTLFISPANALRTAVFPTPPSLFELIRMSLIFSKDFMWDTLKSLPLPSVVSLVMPLILCYLLYASPRTPNEQSPIHTRRTWLLLLLTILTTYGLIVCVCAPSTYGESAYPPPRARFPARFVMTSGLMVVGAILGILATRIHLPFLRVKPILPAVLLLGLTTLYPLRAAWLAYNLTSQYRERAIVWDLRDEQIREAKESGVMHVEVQALDSMEGIKELDLDPKHWVNRCAADVYGVESISAYP